MWYRLSRKTHHLLLIVGGGTGIFAAHAALTGNAKFYQNWIMPAMRLVDAETVHRAAIVCAKRGLMPRIDNLEPSNLKCHVLGMDFANPVGLAAGFDKHGEAVSALLKIGFGFVEIGSVTPEPQDGNAKPRVFRLTDDSAIINRYGFNSDGHDVVHARLLDYSRSISGKPSQPDDRNLLNESFGTGDREKLDISNKTVEGIVGVNLGKNKTSPDTVGDYVKGVKKFGDVADYLVINISSPNTPGLRAMQGREQLQNLLEQVVKARDELAQYVPLLVKIAPDLSEADKIDVASVVAAPKSGIDGLVVSNTTISRPDTLTSVNKSETGGLSGKPLKEMSTKTISEMYRLTQGRLPIIGVGGVSSGQDVYEKIRAGASLVQLYTSLAYYGPPLVNEIKMELSSILEKEGIDDVSQIVGVDHRRP